MAPVNTIYVRNVSDDVSLWIKACAKVRNVSEAEFVRTLLNDAHQAAIAAPKKGGKK